MLREIAISMITAQAELGRGTLSGDDGRVGHSPSGRRTKSENTGACSGIVVTCSHNLRLYQPPKSLIMLGGLCGKTGTSG